MTFRIINVAGANGTAVIGVDAAGDAFGYYYGNTGTHGFKDVGGTITPIDVAGANGTVVTGVDAAGDAFGYSFSNTGTHGFKDVGGTITPIDVVGANGTVVTGVDAAGDAFGYSFGNTGTHGFKEVGGTITPIDVAGANGTEVTGVDTAGDAFGYYWGNTGNQGFKEVGGTITPINVAGADATVVTGVDAAGDAFGYSFDKTGIHGFKEVGGTITPINVAGADGTVVTGVDAAGDAFGYSFDKTGIHGFKEVGGTITPIDVAGANGTAVTGVDASGDAFGYSFDKTGTHGFIYSAMKPAVSFDSSNAAVVGDVNAAHASAAAYTVAGVDADATAMVSFTGISKATGATTSISGNGANGNHTVDLSGFQDGMVTVAISATDTAGNTATGPSTSFALDTTTTETAIADVAVTIGTDHQSYINAVNFNVGVTTLTGAAEAGDTVMVSVNGATATAATVASNGTWSYQITGLADGQSVSAVATATDPAGNTASSSALAFTVDTTTTETAIADVAVTIGTDHQSYINAVNFNGGVTTLTGAAEAGDTVMVSVNGATATAATVASNGTWSYQITGLADGQSVSAVATATDPAGNTASSSALAFTVDTTTTETAIADSAVTIGTDHQSYINAVNFNGGVTTLTGTAPLLMGSTSVEVLYSRFSGGPYSSLGTTLVNLDGSWSFTPTQISDGTYYYVSRSVSSAAVSPNSYESTFTVDRTTTLTGAAEAGDTVMVSVNGTTATAATVASNGTWSYQITGLADGQSVSAVATATDPAGNTASSSAFAFTLDTDQTVVAALAINDTADHVINATEAKTVSFTTSGLEGDETGTVTFSDGTHTKVVSVTGNNTYSVDLSSLSDGTITSSLQVTDPNGNTHSATGKAFALDTDQTVVAALAINDTADHVINATEAKTVSFTTSGLEGDETGTVTFSDGTHTKVVSVTGNNTYSVDLSSLSDGTITSSLQVTDPNGNTHSATGKAFALDTDQTVVAALAINDTADHVINATEAKTVSFTTSGLEGDETGTVTFSDGTHTKVVSVTGNNTYSVDLSSLSDGTITSSLQVTDPNGNTHSATGKAFALDTDQTVVAALAINDTADHVINATEAKTVSFTTSGLEGDETGTVTFSDGTHTKVVSVTGNNTYSVDLSSLSDGTITSSLQVTDPNGNTHSATGKAFALDTDQTVVAALAINDTADHVINATEAKTVSFTTSGLEGDETGTVTFSDGTHTKVVSVTGNNTYSVDLSSLSDGTITSSLQVTDPNGNTHSATGKAFALDTDQTVVAALAINDTADHVINATEAKTVSFTTSGLEGDETGTVTFSDGTHTKVVSVTGNNTYSVDLSSLSDGTITSSLQVTDPNGNTHSATGKAFALDTDQTVVAALAINDTADHVINATEAKTVSFTTSGLEGDETGTVTFSDGTHTKVVSVTGNNTYSVDLSSLSDGTITSSLQVTDPNGNTHSATGKAFALDTDQTVVAALAINDTADHVINATEAKTVSFTTSGLEGDETGTVTFSDGTHTKVVSVTGNNTYSVDLSSLSDGTITSSLQVTDPNGNTHSATGKAFALDTDQTVVAALAINDTADHVINATEAKTVSFTTSGLEGDETGTVTFSDGTHTKVVSVTGNNTYSVDLSSLSDGTITSSLQVTDPNGNTHSATGKAFALDTDQTVVAALAINNSVGHIINYNESKTLSFTVSGLEGDETDAVTFADSAGHHVTKTVTGNGIFSADLSSLTDGTVTASLQVTDPNGNTHQASGSAFSIHTTRPNPTVTNVVDKLVTGSSEANSSVAIYDSGQLLGTVKAGSDGTWSLAVNAPGNVIHSYAETGIDAFGNTGSSSGVALYTPAANKALLGGTGDDVLVGRPNDSLTGGAGHDTFVFNANFGKETVTDFTPGTDVVQFDHTLFADFASVQAHAKQVGLDTVITYDQGDVVALTHVALANLHSTDFHLV